MIMSVSDQLQVNESAIHSLMDRDFRRTPGCLLKYKIGDKTIVHCYDPPHIVKVVRNNLEVKNLKHFIDGRWDITKSKNYGNEQLASWDDVELVYNQDKDACPRSLVKISKEHIHPQRLKMKVNVATQIFSQTLGTFMLDYAKKHEQHSHASGTAQLLLFINDIFDSINGSGSEQRGSLKGSITKDSVHFVFWEWALFMLSRMNYVDKETNKINNRSTVLNKIKSTIRGYEEVTRICLNENIEEVCLRYLYCNFLFSYYGIFRYQRSDSIFENSNYGKILQV